MSQESRVCSHCGAEMVIGSLNTPLDMVHIESWQSMENSSLEAWICLLCGYVELQALGLEKLARHDMSDKELKRFSAGKGSTREGRPGTTG